MASADLKQLTAVITTADRPKCLRRLVRSVQRLAPEMRVLVADHGVESASAKGVDHFRLPPDSGRSAAANALMARIRTRYFLLLDDCCELHRESRIERLLGLVADDKLDIAAGNLTRCLRRFWLFVQRTPQAGHGLLEFSGDQLTLLRGHRSVGDGFLWCDLTHRFYVARTDKIRTMGGWDPELKDQETEEFFVRAHRRGIRVGLAPEVNAWLWHLPNVAARQEGRTLAAAKMGLSQFTDFEGRTAKAPRRAMAA